MTEILCSIHVMFVYLPKQNLEGLKLLNTSDILSCRHGPCLQAIDGLMSLALCLQVVSQAPQHFRSSEM